MRPIPTTLLRQFLDRFQREETERDADSWFVPSEHGMSIRYAHGASGGEAERERGDSQAQAEQRTRR